MSNADLDALDAKWQATTRTREWVSDHASGMVWCRPTQDENGILIAATGVHDFTGMAEFQARSAKREANAAFIAVIHEATPRLIDRIRELEGIIGDFVQDNGVGPAALRELYRRGQVDMKNRAVALANHQKWHTVKDLTINDL